MGSTKEATAASLSARLGVVLRAIEDGEPDGLSPEQADGLRLVQSAWEHTVDRRYADAAEAIREALSQQGVGLCELISHWEHAELLSIALALELAGYEAEGPKLLAAARRAVLRQAVAS